MGQSVLDRRRRKLQGKTPPPQFVPAGYVAVCPTPLLGSRLSRELQTEVFAINFGSCKQKPRRLEPEPLQVGAVGNALPPLTEKCSGKYFTEVLGIVLGKTVGEKCCCNHIIDSIRPRCLSTRKLTASGASTDSHLPLAPSHQGA